MARLPKFSPLNRRLRVLYTFQKKCQEKSSAPAIFALRLGSLRRATEGGMRADMDSILGWHLVTSG